MYQERVREWAKHWDFILLELLCYQVSFCLACMLRHGMVNVYYSSLYRNMAIVTAFVQFFIIIGFDLFDGVLRRGYYQEFLNVVKTTLAVMLIQVFYLFAIQQGEVYSRMVLITNGIYYMLLSYLIRGLWKYKRKREQERQKRHCKSLLLITDGKRAEELIASLREDSYGEYQITGIIVMDEAFSGGEIEGIPIVSNKEEAAEYICKGWVDEVFYDGSKESLFYRELSETLLDMDMVVHVCIKGGEIFPQKRLQRIGKYTVVTMSSGISDFKNALIKRTIDLAGGIVGCIATGIIFILVAPIIFINSPGPVLFSQVRVGRNGKLFKIYKFRSMYLDAEDRKKELQAQNQVLDGRMFKIENDPRIIGSEKGPGKGIGNFIRRTSLDEFPQFFNVLKGDMSLVGTRPPTVDEWEQYEYHHRGRLAIKPGLTGLWQVSGRSEIKDFEEVVRLDKEYISEWSLGLDVKILIRTVGVVLGKGGV